MHPSTSKTRRAARGQALAEFLLIVPVVLIVLLGMKALSDYGLARQQAIASARLMAWERSAWLPASVAGQGGVGGAVKKEDVELTRDIIRHVLRDRRADPMDMHRGAMLEFDAAAPGSGIDPRQSVRIVTTQAQLPTVLRGVDAVFRTLRDTQNVLKDTYLTRPLGNFQFLTGGYLKSKVTLTHRVDGFVDLPQAQFTEQVTMLTEAWNAGGTSRENAKISGIVPLKLLDAPFYQQVRSGPHQTASLIKNNIDPGFDGAQIEFGWKPGATDEVAPLDRFEQRKKNGQVLEGKYRYYLSFPPAPPRESLP